MSIAHPPLPVPNAGKTNGHSNGSAVSNGRAAAIPSVVSKLEPLSNGRPCDSQLNATVGALVRQIQFHDLKNIAAAVWGFSQLSAVYAKNYKYDDITWVYIERLAQKLEASKSRFMKAFECSVWMLNPNPDAFTRAALNDIEPEFRQRPYAIMREEMKTTLQAARHLGILWNDNAAVVMSGFSAEPAQLQEAEDWVESASIILSNLDGLEEKFSKTLAFCERHPGAYTPASSMLPVGDFVREALQPLQSSDSYARVQLHLGGLLAEGKPSEMMASADPVYLELILSNLLTNAYNYSGVEKAEPHVFVSLSSREGKLVLQISNSGLGVAPELADTLFGYGVSGSGSSGLGLYFCHEAARAMGGKLTLVSAQPAVFELALPASAEPTEPSPEKKTPLPAPAPAPDPSLLPPGIYAKAD